MRRAIVNDNGPGQDTDRTNQTDDRNRTNGLRRSSNRWFIDIMRSVAAEEADCGRDWISYD